MDAEPESVSSDQAFRKDGLAEATYEVLDVRESARWVIERAVEVQINQAGIELAANQLLPSILTAQVSLQGKPTVLTDWHSHPLHPPLPRREDLQSSEAFEEARDKLLHWIFLVSVLNFSFWSSSPSTRFSVRCGPKDVAWTGYWSLLAALHRAIEEGCKEILEPTYYGTIASDADLRYVFRPDRTHDEPMPLLSERIKLLREVGSVIVEKYNGKVRHLVERANCSAIELVKLLVQEIPGFRDEALYASRRVGFYKRAQILVAEVWAAFEGEGIGHFDDIERLTMFADYRVPQILQTLGMVTYSPRLINMLESYTNMENGSKEEVEIRAGSVIAVELMRSAIEHILQNKKQLSPGLLPSSIELDFWLWDLAKRQELEQKSSNSKRVLVPHHCTRSIYY
ncbi:hypothetical protein CROQUDRAFT_661055 [Cronartium quercuum f. sp. fusiforme G11]|uniref:Queuosine 5'-phosphate N-glycosylase/hydrolase n=1 Tax=Cronartium quercuum f. sp. fusiforme G11 TaxID=708437 RepID=A0A9P6NHC4_9BASI|nr:hypothetical protein CROQUDRAFT_661055 [Cronartium quercuum f. sp. fusiforme G11]